MSQIPSTYIKALSFVVCVGVLSTACVTKNTNAATASNDYYGVPAMYRTIPERISDEAIERSGYKNLTKINGVSENNVRIAIDSFRREVLLTGEVPSEQIKHDVAHMMASIHDVKKVYNNLTVTATPKAQSHTLHENYLKSKIITKIMSAGGIKSSQYKLVVRNNMAYLLGFLTAQQEQTFVNIIQSVQGMEGVKMLSTRVDGDTSLLAATGNNVAIDDGVDAGGVVYGGINQGMSAGTGMSGLNSPFAIMPMNGGADGAVYPSTSTPTSAYPQSMYPAGTSPVVHPNTGGAYNPNVPIVRMEGNPTSPYVNLYNNTSKP